MISVLIVARRGALRNALVALVDSIPGIETTMLTDSYEQAVHLASAQTISLTVLDGNLFHRNGWARLQEMRRRATLTRLMVLLGDESKVPVGEELAADAALPQGISPAELVAHIERLLEPSADSNGIGDK